MTISTTTRATAAPAVAGEEIASHQTRNILIGLFAVALLFVLTYAFAWSRADALSNTYMHDADASYQAGDYLAALVGGQKFDLATNSYKQLGGYLQVQHIWNNSFAWPRPAGLEHAQQRIDDIVNHKLTLDQALQFVQENTGKQNPYLGIIYLRLGELYQQQGDTKDARDIYQSIPQLFGNDQNLIDQAQQRLKQMGG